MDVFLREYDCRGLHIPKIAFFLSRSPSHDILSALSWPWGSVEWNIGVVVGLDLEHRKRNGVEKDAVNMVFDPYQMCS